MILDDLEATLKPVVRVLDHLSIPFFVGGSIASSALGVARATMDVDLVADFQAHHIAQFEAALRADFYLDSQAIATAVARCQSFNLVNLSTAWKVDIFVLKRREYDQQSLRRTKLIPLFTGDRTATVAVASAEDLILNKLEWYVAGGGTSDRQWLDVLGLIKVQNATLDRPYLKTWAASLKLTTLLEKAFVECRQAL